MGIIKLKRPQLRISVSQPTRPSCFGYLEEDIKPIELMPMSIKSNNFENSGVVVGFVAMWLAAGAYISMTLMSDIYYILAVAASVWFFTVASLNDSWLPIGLVKLLIKKFKGRNSKETKLLQEPIFEEE